MANGILAVKCPLRHSKSDSRRMNGNCYIAVNRTPLNEKVALLCSRYSLTSPPEAVRRFFDLPSADDFPPRYNIAPSQPVLIVRLDARGYRELRLVKWGLVPSWAKDPRRYTTLINARSETAPEKPSFRGPTRHRRCLIPATGYYEWTGGRGSKQPQLIRLKDQELFAIAGLWEAWLGADGSEIETMTILTTEANGDAAPLHDRMPVIIERKDYGRWLDCSSGSEKAVLDLLRPLPAGRVTLTPVNPKLNDPRAEGPDLHEPPIPTLL
jgi:putative SOS response-associated peptidase YedK